MVVFGIPNVTLLRAIDFLGLLMQDCLMHSTSSSDVLGQTVDFCFSTVPISLNWFIHRFKALSVGGFSPGCKLRHCDNWFQFCIPQHKLSLLVNRPHPAAHWLKLKDNDASVPKSPPLQHVDDSPPAWTSPQSLKVTHLRFPCKQRAPPLFKLCLILQ